MVNQFDSMDIKLYLYVLIFVNHVCFSLDILSKFHQTDYNIRNIRLEVIYVNKEYMNDFQAIGYKYNRTTTAINCTFSPKIDLEDKAECVLQAYKRASNEYSLFPMRFQVNVCRSIATNAAGLKNIVNYGNITLCFWKKDTSYYLNGFLINESNLPPFIPTGEYKHNIEVIHHKNKLLTFHFYMEIYRPEVKK